MPLPMDIGCGTDSTQALVFKKLECKVMSSSKTGKWSELPLEIWLHDWTAAPCMNTACHMCQYLPKDFPYNPPRVCVLCSGDASMWQMLLGQSSLSSRLQLKWRQAAKVAGFCFSCRPRRAGGGGGGGGAGRKNM